MKSLDYLRMHHARQKHLRQIKLKEIELQEKKRRWINRFSAVALVSIACFSGSKAFASEADCLSKIIYAETSGHSIEHAVAIGQAAVTKAENDDTNVCQLSGVKRKQPPKAMVEYYRVLSKQLLDKPKTTVSKGADHWNQGTRPKFYGVFKRQFDNQVLYTMAPRGEK